MTVKSNNDNAMIAFIAFLVVTVFALLFIVWAQDRRIKASEELNRVLNERIKQREEFYRENCIQREEFYRESLKYINDIINRQDSLIRDLYETRLKSIQYGAHE